MTMTVVVEKQNDEMEKVDNSLFVRYSAETSFSGLKHVAENSSARRRLIWLLVVLLALSGLMYQIVRSTEKFMRRPTSTKLTYEEKDELDFPAITICNMNMFSQTSLRAAYGGLYELQNVGFDEIKLLFPFAGLVDHSDTPLPDQFPGGSSLFEFVKENAHTKEETIKACQFNGEDCTSSNFTTTVTNYGVCYTFNSVSVWPKQKITTPGQLQGLSLVLLASVDTHIPSPREYTGFKVLIHPRDEVPDLRNFGVEVDVGKHTSLRVQPREITRLSEPYGTCVRLSKPKYLKGNYTKEKCFLECETDFIVSNCSCRSFYMPGDAPYCDPNMLVNCVYSNHKYFSSKKKDICKCHDACDESRYSVSISQSTFPSETLPLLLQLKFDFSYEQWAFVDELAFRAASSVGTVYNAGFLEIYTWLTEQRNEDGLTLEEAFPDADLYTLVNGFWGVVQPITYVLLEYCIAYVYENVRPEFNVKPVNASYGSPVYFMAEEQVRQSYLHSGFYKTTFATSLSDTFQSYKPENMTLDAFGDAIYEDYKLDEGFQFILSCFYPKLYAFYMEVGQSVIQTTNMYDLTTKSMRSNMAMAEIYFGSMEVESITEQKDYELFQFICDWGGALGLFFGASLISFIETIDFFCRDYSRKKK
ncbi:acid-sensing ion channel 1A-like [Amphiura filiformis]|uniref:acid-sensing ion channel 1A-like n=1 Tax=Amphiura filiformis TaxID=82378 RepID=UPI003B2219A7